MKSITAIAILWMLCVTASRASEEAKEPTVVELSQLTPEMDGAEVVMTFRVAESYRISGGVPKGRVPSFGIEVVVGESDPRFSVNVAGDLADAMGRFGYRPNNDKLNLLVIEAQGKIRVYPAPQDDPKKGPSYKLIMNDWKRFRFKE